MHDWLRTFHGRNQAFPASDIALRIGITLAVGLLVGFEREWSNKDIGARTFAMAALLGLLGSLLGPGAMFLSAAAVLILIVFANLRSLGSARKLEATTSLALALIYLLGDLVGQGHIFTPMACSILIAMLLALKPQFRAFAGGLTQQEIRSAILLGLLGFVVWPLLPGRFVDPWHLIQPREAWIIVVVVACLGFLNYVLLRVYGSRGVFLTAVLGGLVNSTASAAELASTLSTTGLASLAVPVVLLTSVAMFLRNIVILAIFAPAAVRTAALPLLAMAAVAGIWVYRDRRKADDAESSPGLTLTSPVSLSLFALAIKQWFPSHEVLPVHAATTTHWQYMRVQVGMLTWEAQQNALVDNPDWWINGVKQTTSRGGKAFWASAGERGWELVSTMTESNLWRHRFDLGFSAETGIGTITGDTANGVTTDLVYFFKRPAP